MHVHALRAQDGSLDVRYDVYVGDELATRFVGSLEDELLVDCGSRTLLTSTVVAPGAQVEVRAVDLAGNVPAPATAVAVQADCEHRADAAAADGGASQGGSSDRDSAAGGCGVSQRSAGFAWPATAIAAAAVLGWRRRRR